jgi:glucokinase
VGARRTTTSVGHTLGIDIGGTKLAAVVLDASRTIVRRATRPTPQAGTSEELIGAVRELIAAVAGEDIAAVGIASAGPIDARAGTIAPVNITGWRNFPIVATVAELTGGAPVALAGDAVCAALAELRLGAGRGWAHGLVAVVSTGVGGGIFLDGSIVSGRAGNAGHIGHIVIEQNGERCACGSVGCVEAYASAPSMVRRALRSGWQPDGPADGAGLLGAARRGDDVAIEAVRVGALAIAAMIASTTATLELEIAVLGGGVMHSADVFLPEVRRALERYRGLPFVAEVEVRVADLGSDASAVGAALLPVETATEPL